MASRNRHREPGSTFASLADLAGVFSVRRHMSSRTTRRPSELLVAYTELRPDELDEGYADIDHLGPHVVRLSVL